MEPPKELLVNQADQLDACCAHLAECSRLGLDTEFVGETSYHPELCLVQVATETVLYLIDPFAFPALDGFWKFIASPSHRVVVHAGREEVRLCHRAFGQVPARLFDLQIAAGLAGLPYPLGHGSLVHQVLGKKLMKGETLTEWRHRPLTPSQIHYAFDDVRYLLPAQEKLEGRLQHLNRSPWAEEEFQRLTELATPEEPSAEAVGEKWRKVRGASSLDRRRLAVLRELYVWREQTAHDLNRPARVIVRDDLLVEIARRAAKSARDLRVIRGLAHKHLDEIFAAVERGRGVPLEQCPALQEREQDPPQVGLAVSLLQAALYDFATKEHLAPNLVASNQDVKNLVRAFMAGDIGQAGSLLTRGWRGQFVLPHLLAILEGRRTLRIADLRADAPLAYGDESL
ncbi:MAG: HRDC domain-containing protein [Gemmataceae bacterium]|nr:HRDC domain-containing protein [Gemmataceae bacterium]